MSIRTSAQTEQLDEAFAKAQAKFTSAAKSTEGQIQNRKYKYADLGNVIEATLKYLNAEGIAVRQHPGFEYRQIGESMEPFMTVTTRLSYKGQWEESDIAIPAVNKGNFDAQSCGSALTYACRYALQGIGVVAREDDDGAAATGRGTHEAAQAVAKEKIAAIRASNHGLNGNIDKTDSTIYYSWHNESQTATITGPDILLKLHKPYLKQFWNPGVKALVMNAEQLENAKYEFEQRKVPFQPKES